MQSWCGEYQYIPEYYERVAQDSPINRSTQIMPCLGGRGRPGLLPECHVQHYHHDESEHGNGISS